jgi:hypothetical protein
MYTDQIISYKEGWHTDAFIHTIKHTNIQNLHACFDPKEYGWETESDSRQAVSDHLVCGTSGQSFL